MGRDWADCGNVLDMHVGMLWNVVRTLSVALLVLGCARTALAQATPPPAPDPPKQASKLLDRLKEPDQGGGVHLTEHFAVVFGGIKSGSGIALGPAFSHKAANGAYTQIKGVYSVKKFALLQARYDSQPFWNQRATLTSRVRWQDAPKLRVFRLGPDAPDLSVDYTERKTEGSARLRMQLTRRYRIASGLGIERYVTTGGRIDLTEKDTLPAVPPLPGLATNPWYVHAFFSAAADSRTSADYSRTGHLFEAALHSFSDVHDNQDAFGRFEGTAQQLIPTHGGKGVIDLSGQTWLSLSDGLRSVPFFLMPTLGGSNYLRAYPSYRFRDRHAIFLRGEYRWAVHTMLDVAGVLEAGKVAPTVGGLRLSNMAESIGVGVRVHTKTSSLVDLDVAHGRDGFKFTIGFNSGGS
jgi:hypothetical protein